MNFKKEEKKKRQINNHKPFPVKTRNKMF